MKKMVVFLLVVAVSGCATPYQEIGEAGGYVHQRLDEDVYRITFSGNGFTDYKTARDYAFLRAAEVCDELGYTHFTIEGQEDRSSRETIDMGSTSYTSGSVYGYGRSASYYGTTNTYDNTIPVLKPGVVLTVRYFNGKPTTGRYLGLLEAKAVIAELRQKYSIGNNGGGSRPKAAFQDAQRKQPRVAQENHGAPTRPASNPSDQDDKSAENRTTPIQPASEPSSKDTPARKTVGYKIVRDRWGNFVKDENGNWVILPVYEGGEG